MIERMAAFSFRIRKKYFDEIVAGKKTVEYRRNSPFWSKRVANSLSDPKINFPVRIALRYLSFPVDATGVFICGKRIHRRKITRIDLMKTPEDFSDQGKKDVNTELCFAFHLGAVIQ